MGGWVGGGVAADLHRVVMCGRGGVHVLSFLKGKQPGFSPEEEFGGWLVGVGLVACWWLVHTAWWHVWWGTF